MVDAEDTALRVSYFYRFLPIRRYDTVLVVYPDYNLVTKGLAQDYKRIIQLFDEPFLQNKLGIGDQLNGFSEPLDSHSIDEGMIDLIILHDLLNLNVIAHRKYSWKVSLLRKLRKLLDENGMVGMAGINRLNLGHITGKSNNINKDNSTEEGAMTLWGYKRLLLEAGYKDIKIYNAIPYHNNPVYLVSTDSVSSRMFYRYRYNEMNNRGCHLKKIIRRTVLSLNLFRYLEHSFFISAKR